jgi:predicted secreted protein
LELDLHADGGYQWYYGISNTTVVQIDSTSYRSKSGELIDGGLTIETLYFQTKTNGQCAVNLTERRGWEEDIPPINTVQFGVVVK